MIRRRWKSQKAEYEAVRPARYGLNAIISVEERYDGLMENYVELEQTLHNLGIRPNMHYTELVAPLNLMGRRVSNLRPMPQSQV
jgi:hypothetical protein